MDEKPVYLGIMGLGTVGSGAVKILQQNFADITQRTGRRLAVKKVLVRNPDKPRPVTMPQGVLTTDPAEVLEDPEIRIVVEVIGGISPAKEYILQAIHNGKHVVTANKELIAKEGRELLTSATNAGVNLFFEGSVAGGIPIVKSLKECLSANLIQTVMGIINGTTNYILTAMTQQGADFAEVLREAQEKGYAESDPSNDVDGKDAAYKLAILASIAFGTRVRVDQIYTEGIRRITAEDIRYARELGFVIKLLAIGKEHPGQGIEVRVQPAFVPHQHPLAAVGGVFNAVFVQGDAVGDMMFYGRGAGDLPTGSAVVADIMDIAKNLGGKVNPACSCYTDKPVIPMEETRSKYYVRTAVLDKPGVLAQIAGAFGDAGVSLSSVIQKGHGMQPVTLVFVTHEVKEGDLRRAIEKIRCLPVVDAVHNVIRVEDRR
ncbi:MAG: homoserine dehydrogenase [Syntrophothermus sp.]